MLNDTTNNYLKACADWRQKFLAMDQSQLLKALPEIAIQGDYLTLTLFGRKFGIHSQTGYIVTLADLQPAEVVSQLNISTPCSALSRHRLIFATNGCPSANSAAPLRLPPLLKRMFSFPLR